MNKRRNIWYNKDWGENMINAIYDLSAAYRNFFEKRAKYPKFKSRKRSKNSYTTNMTNGNISIGDYKSGKGTM